MVPGSECFAGGGSGGGGAECKTIDGGGGIGEWWCAEGKVPPKAGVMPDSEVVNDCCRASDRAVREKRDRSVGGVVVSSAPTPVPNTSTPLLLLLLLLLLEADEALIIGALDAGLCGAVRRTISPGQTCSLPASVALLRFLSLDSGTPVFTLTVKRVSPAPTL